MLPRTIVFSFGILLAGALAAQPVSPVRLANLTVEHQKNPLGLGESQPRLSWQLDSNRRGETQTAYEIRAASTAAALAGTPDLWSSGKVASDQSVLVPWGGKDLGSRSQVFWQVRVWDKDGQPSAWSEPATFELGLLKPSVDWKGQWITADLPRYDFDAEPLARADWITTSTGANQAIAARLTFDLPADAKIVGATIDAIAPGVVSLYANGKATLQGPTSHAAPFHANFGQNLVPGKNVIALGATPARAARGATGGANQVAAHIVIELADGTRIEHNTDDKWKISNPAPVVAARGGRGFGGPPPATTLAWATPEFDDSQWELATANGPYPAKPLAGSNSSTIGAGRYLRKGFTVKGPVAKARLYSTALGTYEAFINGQRVNDHQLDPGFTDYNKRVMVQTTDVTNLLKPGANALGALVNDGWFAGELGWMGVAQFSRVSDHPSFNAQLEITYADGTTETIATDGTWKGGRGMELGSDEHLGEVLDARKAVAWDQPTFDDAAWKAATVEEHPAPALVPQVGPPVRELMELTPKKITKQGNVWLVDFGQNMVGHIRLKAKGPAGAVIEATHGEMLNPDGTLFTENLRSAISLDKFILKGGNATETFEPQFTFHGFRYCALLGYPGDLTADDIRGIVVGSDNPNAGTWETSNSALNQLYSNIRWGQRGNFLSVPTDCPQRDERLGWMGDAQVFAPTAALNADVAGFYTKWMHDVDDAQNDAGAYSTVAPRANQADAYPVWGDAGLIVPWAMYQAYGDKNFLADNYPYMARWVNHVYNLSNDLVVSATSVGDHLAPVPTPVPIMDTAYFANSARIMAKAAAILGRTDDAAGYDKLYHAIADAFTNAFVSEDGTIQGDTQTDYIVALKFGLLPESLRAAAAQKLAENVEKNQHLTTGFPGTGLLNPMLTQIGRSDLAWKLLLTDSYPSWLFSVKNGATTIWERWDAWTPDKGFQASSMNSFNHYSFGAVGYWLYTGAAGIMPDEASPGYKHFFLAPQISDRVDFVKASYDSPYGKIVSNWQFNGDQVNYDVTVPPNSNATLQLPVPPQDVKESGQPIAATGTTTSLPLAAGTYRFSFPKNLLK
ncbi:MAG TPA: glycoside hydrolase family 78 protein [Opitutales bacterium]|nr:glycoside hydrolase family 78 protein [Opitutales bacterium]